MIKNVRRGDTVVTTGGIIGKVAKVLEDSADIEVDIAEGVRVKIAVGDLRGPRERRARQGLRRSFDRACAIVADRARPGWLTHVDGRTARPVTCLSRLS